MRSSSAICALILARSSGLAVAIAPSLLINCFAPDKASDACLSRAARCSAKASSSFRSRSARASLAAAWLSSKACLRLLSLSSLARLLASRASSSAIFFAF